MMFIGRNKKLNVPNILIDNKTLQLPKIESQNTLE